MKIQLKTWNDWFNVFILVGMIVVVCIVNGVKIAGLDMPEEMRSLVLLVVASIAAVMGVVNTVLSANGNILTFLFGLVDVVLTSVVLWDNGIYGNFALHVFYFLPMQFIGFWQWRKRGARVSSENGEDKAAVKVRARRLNGIQWLWTGIAFVVMAFISYCVLLWIDAGKAGDGSWTAFQSVLGTVNTKILLDSLVFTFNVLGQVLMSFAFMEQWYLWNLVNVFSILMWAQTLAGAASGYTVVMLVKYIFYLLNSVNGLRIWIGLSRSKEAGE